MPTRGLWLTDQRPLQQRQPCACWLSEPEGNASGLGILILPPIGYESSSSYRLWRTIAERLAHGGATAMRLDYWGTGDSAGDITQVSSLDPWRSSVSTASAFLRDRGFERIAVVACQLGVLLAVLEVETLAPVKLVAVAPTLSGRRFVRGLSVLGLQSSGDIGGMSVGGHFLSASVLEELSGVTVSPPADLPLLQIDSGRVASMLTRPAEEAEVPTDVVDEIVSWTLATDPATEATSAPTAANASGTDGCRIAEATSVRLNQHGVEVLEEIVSLGPSRLVGVLTSPGHGTSSTGAVYVLVNSGSDPHIGPGRAWVELARQLAATGVSTMRVDMRGWGESPDGPRVPGRPYDAHGIDDVVSIVQDLKARGYEAIVLGGLCAGAWIALRAARLVDIAGSVLLNPQLYWQFGDPVVALVSEGHAIRLNEIASIKADALAGRWDAEDDAGIRAPAGEWLDELVTRGQMTSLLFAEGDDGVEYLRDRLSRRLERLAPTGRVRVAELPQVDHGMHQTWLRPIVFDAVQAEIHRIVDGRIHPGSRQIHPNTIAATQETGGMDVRS